MLESSKYKPEVWEFIKWMYTSEDGIAYFDYNSGYVASSRTLANTELLQRKQQENPNYANAYGYLENVNNNHLVKGNASMYTSYLNFIDSVFYDLEDVTAQWDVLEAEVNERLAEANEL
jgi:ABC-type glycerol-3-phosphate transport system substrate-binding protein